MKNFLKRQGFATTRIVTDKLQSYQSAIRTVGPKTHIGRSAYKPNYSMLVAAPHQLHEAKCYFPPAISIEIT
jgi:transposase-like protein